MSITTKVEDIFDDIVKKKLLEVSRRQQKYLLYIYLSLSSLCCFLAFWGGLNKPLLHYWLIGITLIPITSYFFLQKYHYFHWVWYYLLSNFFIFLGGILVNSSLLALPEVFIVLAATGYIFIHLFVIAPIEFILAESLVAFILFFWVQKEQLTDTHSIFDAFLILGSIVVAAFTAIQKYQMTKREVVAQTIIYHSNQKLHQQQQEIVEQNQKIIEKEHNLRGIVDNSNIAIWLVDRHYSLIEFNEKFRQYMWVTYQEEVHYGENIFDIIQKHTSMLFWKGRLEKAFQGEKQTYIDYYPEFNHNYIQIDIFPIWFEQQIQSVSILGKNITKQKNAEMTIQHNQMLLSSISKNIREGIYRSNEKELIYANEAFTELFGYQESEVFYIKPSDFYADIESREEVISQVQKAGFIDNKEVLFKKKDGSTFWALMSLIAQKDSEGNTYFDGAIRDITQIKEIKEQIEIQNQELKKINNELDRFVYSASHDLKAPLASILGLINVAKMEQEPSLLYGYMDMIQEAIIK
ncbi:MAG: PAS domain S-box protein, partial [Thermonemataceae bacterium]|nr:PAS domain S-box protein [Thermonemataceae bacterium]